MRRAVGLVAGAAILGLLAIWATAPDAPPPAPPAPQPQQTEAPAVVAPVRTLPEAAPPAQAGEFVFRRVIADDRADPPEACLVFSRDLDASGATRYADYLRISGNARTAVRVAGARLCLSGLAFGKTHAVTLKRGLPAADGAALAADAEVQVDFADRPQTVSFGNGFVLPRDSADGLPIATVNVDRLDLSVYRANDRILARLSRAFVDDRNADGYGAHMALTDSARPVWHGEMPVDGARNAAVTSLFPFAEAIGKARPGAYLVVARAITPDDDPNAPRAMQWVVRSDLGLTAFGGDDGLSLAVRSLATAKPVTGVRVTLIARDADELGAATTDADGIARFDPGLLRGGGAATPVMAMAYAGEDFNFLDLRRPGFDLADRGVAGRPPAPAADAFLYADRGIYRPGETVHAVALLRDQTAHALPGRTLVLKAIRPDGREYRRFVVADTGGGAGAVDLALPKAAPRGGWEITAHADPEGAAIGRLGFEVQDFVPQRLAVDIDAAPARLAPGAAIDLGFAARFLYGAPAADLSGEAEVAVAPDPEPFPAQPGFRWGREEESFTAARGELEVAATDAAGRSRAAGRLPEFAATSLPLRATVTIAVHEPGGRATTARAAVAVRSRDAYLGVRPRFDGSVREGAEAAFEVIAVDADGARRELAAEWRIFRDVSTWQWFRSGSQWRYERIGREREVASGSLAIGAEAPAVAAKALPWGEYRFEVRDPASGAATSVKFWSGWYGEAAADRPDRLKLAADKPGYRTGETARLRIDGDAAGEALLVIAGERVHAVRNLAIPAGGAEIEVPVSADWGPGAYALVTLYRPLDDKLGHAPVRAVGVAWLGLDAAARRLDVALGAPERALPRRTVEVPVTVQGAGAHAFVTLAAVDQGILQLTGFRSPDPVGHYLGQRRLGVTMRDDYGRLIRTLAAEGDDAGGDGFGGEGLDATPTRTVALFSGLVALDASGSARVRFDIPDFQGELRLMAVAFDADKVGAAEARLTVRDDVVAEVILPRFLAPGDLAAATVNLHNLSGAPGDYRVRVGATGAVSATAERAVALPLGTRETYAVPIAAGNAGLGEVNLAVEGPGGFRVERTWPIQVRAAQLPRTVETTAALPPGTEVRLGPELLAGFVPGTAHASASVSRWPRLDVPGLLRWLDRYPFGCLEQTVSRAMPLLDFNDVALLAGAAEDRGIDIRIQEAIERIAAMQSYDGFRMWGPWGDAAHPWLSAFAMDFLERAAAKGFDVPAATLASGRRYLAELMAEPAPRRAADDARAYAALVLARKGLANPADLRYLHDARRPTAPLALAQLGAALEAAGERGRARDAFDAALRRFAEADAARPAERDRSAYGGPLRDLYAIAALLAESGQAAAIPDLLERAKGFDTRAEATTTQDKAWMLRFAAAASGKGGRIAVTADGEPLPGDPAALPLPVERLETGVALANRGAGEVYRTVSVAGVPTETLPPETSRIALAKRIHHLDGRPADPATVKRNDRLVVVLEGHLRAAPAGDYAVLDLLPSGWEIEATLAPGQAGFDWIGNLSRPRLQEARDDRYVAALDLPADQPQDAQYRPERDTFRLAYVVRAVTAGEFALPAAVAEAMYAPGVRGRTAVGRLGIAP